MHDWGFEVMERLFRYRLQEAEKNRHVCHAGAGQEPRFRFLSWARVWPARRTSASGTAPGPLGGAVKGVTEASKTEGSLIL
jgi:hypothetical protein